MCIIQIWITIKKLWFPVLKYDIYIYNLTNNLMSKPSKKLTLPIYVCVCVFHVGNGRFKFSLEKPWKTCALERCTNCSIDRGKWMSITDVWIMGIANAWIHVPNHPSHAHLQYEEIVKPGTTTREIILSCFQ